MEIELDAPQDPTQRRERWIVAGLAAFAALRVFVFAAAFPFFHNVDEHMHVDLVLKYARGFLPGPEDAHFEADTARYLLFQGSPEYMVQPDPKTGRGMSGPRQKKELRRADPKRAQRRIAEVARGTNIEAEAPPVYYVVTAGWYSLGRSLRFGPLASLYWMRWLAVAAVAALVAVTWIALRSRYPDDAFMRLAPPLLLASFPNDLFFGVTADVLSPLLGAASFFALLDLREGRFGLRGAVGVGLLLAVTFLNKYSNAAFLALAGLLFVGALLETWRRRTSLGSLAPWACMGVGAAVGILPWLIRNALVVGSVTGTHRKIAWLDWALKEPAEWFDHPLFTLSGWAEYLPSLIANFWRGEFVWHRERIANGTVDDVYVISTAVLLAVAGVAWVRRRGSREGLRLEGCALGLCALGVGLLAGLSLLFQYTTWGAPRVDFPYLASGRLLGGAFAPFAILYVRGIRQSTSWLPGRWAAWAAWAALAAVVAVCVGSEIALSRGVFASEFNWYHRSG